MKFCTHCGNQLKDTDLFCAKCGAAAPKVTTSDKVCAHCGNQLKDTDKFCTKCGATAENRPIEVKAEATPVIAPEYTAPQPEVSFSDPMAAEKNRKKATKALVFGILSFGLFWAPLLGIIFASIAKKYSGEVLANNPTGANKVLARIGRIHAVVALPFAIFFNAYYVFVILYCVLLVVLAMLGIML